MNSPKKIVAIVCLLLLCVSQSGCALLALPAQIFGSAVNLAGQALQVASSLPTPPPGVFF